MSKARVVVLVVLVALIAAFFAFDLKQYFSLDFFKQQQAAIDASQGDVRIDPIRNRGQRVGRNDPCPCGSGKKYKMCCMRKGG